MFYSNKVLFFIFIAVGVLGQVQDALSIERILLFESRTRVQDDASLVVEEIYLVKAEGEQIRHGIYREFPTEYVDPFGLRRSVGFRVVSVERNGESEFFRVKSYGNGVRIYIGREDVTLPAGLYSYRLVYVTDRQLGFFEDHDELYWNVTGNGWMLPIDRVVAEVVMPLGVPRERIQVAAYTGAKGQRGRDFRIIPGDSANIVRFETSRILDPGEGLTISIGWPKGYVQVPGLWKQARDIIKDNAGIMVGMLGFFILAVYYIFAWLLVGRDPATGVIYPRYKPPNGMSPAAVRFVWQKGYDDLTLVACLVGLAVRGMLTISEGRGIFVLQRNSPTESVTLTTGEIVVLEKLFQRSEKIRLSRSKKTARLLQRVMNGHLNALYDEFAKKSFRINGRWANIGKWFGVGISVVMLMMSPHVFNINMIVLMLLAAFAGMAMMPAVQGWRRGYFIPAIILAISLVLMLLIYFASTNVSIAILIVVLLISATVTSFREWLKAPTRAGRELLDELEGFREYLSVAEADELRLKHPPEKTPELFERYLPYAIAFGVEDRWARRFQEVFGTGDNDGKTSYPHWYNGYRRRSDNLQGFANTVSGSLSQAISSASVPPGSNSGLSSSRRSGFSGGGGGGGGGGGW